MTAEATPGPWKVRSERWVVATRGEHEGAILIAPTYWMEHVPQEAAANARLIAASPTMLSALQVTSANLSSLIAAQHHDAVLMTEWRAAVDAAIALATGATA